MKTKINFKSGFLAGSILGVLLIIFGYFSFQEITKKAEDVANIDLHQFEYQDIHGNDVQLSDYEGKHLLVNFWATWCAPCIKEFPVLDETYTTVKEDFVFIMVSDEPIDKIKTFASKTAYDFIYLKTNNLLFKGITYVPQTFVFDSIGTKKYHHPTIFEGSASSITQSLRQWANN